MKPMIFLREIGELIRKLIVRAWWLALGLAIIGGIAAAWTSLDTSYLDLPAASITFRQTNGWTIALFWRALLTLIAFFAVRGCWRKQKGQ